MAKATLFMFRLHNAFSRNHYICALFTILFCFMNSKIRKFLAGHMCNIKYNKYGKGVENPMYLAIKDIFYCMK